MASFPDKLTALQREVLEAFFRHERRFFLTGGAALAGFYLGHRVTDDLDLFTHEREAFETGVHALAAAVDELGARTTVRQEAPGFRRYVVTRGEEAVVVDLVWERVPSAYPDKPERGGVRIDRLEEILINKLTTVVSRAEERDLVDLFFLERAGHRAETALTAALAKDGGCTPAVLAWVLAQIEIPEGAVLPGGVTATELRAYVADLVKRLRRSAAPKVQNG
ncbi:MAG: nucleotidyl transferase AbiEii/AbiGii toxin family protein [Acidobacteria bacterium]|nr:nucleotidyl transferase AbiEii/AbiGii toxin family protein [Acidobacteriota bacterium]